jgi:glucose-1-phosphate thymidylyltransferase
VYFLRPDAFSVIGHLVPSGRGEFEITDVLNHYILTDTLFWKKYDGHWSDAGTIDSLLIAGTVAAGAALETPVTAPDRTV